jgi:hypothetical protein
MTKDKYVLNTTQDEIRRLEFLKVTVLSRHLKEFDM